MKLQIIVFYTTWVLFLFILLIIYMNYHYFNVISLNLNIIKLIVISNPFSTIAVIIVLSLIIIYQYKLYKEKINNRRNCQITYVDLEKIAHLWLEYEELEDNIEHKIMDKMKVSFDESKKDIQDVINTLIGNRTISDMSFYKKYVFNYIDSFSKQELEIVASLYELLEVRAKELPSVATLYKNDIDKNIYKDIVSEKLTSYEILYKVNLFDHTMNVVNNMYEILINEKDTFVFGWSKMLIAALSHDIGKIEKIEMLKGLSGIDKVKYENNTHENLSRLILSNAFPSYEHIDDVCEIIEKHHLQNLDDKNKNYKLIKMLKNADQQARKQEIKEYLNSKKENNITNELNKINKGKEIEKNIIEQIIVEQNSIIMNQEQNSTLDNINTTILEEPKEDNIVKDVIAKHSDQEKDVEKEQEKTVIIHNADTFFNFDDIVNLVEHIINNINVVEISPKTKRVKIISISQNSELFIPKEIFLKFCKINNLNVSTDKNLKDLLNKLKNDLLFKYEIITTLDGFCNAAYKTRKEYLVFDLNTLGINIDEAELKKRNTSELRNVSVVKAKKDE